MLKYLINILFILPLVGISQGNMDYTISTPYKNINAEESYYFPYSSNEKTLIIKIKGKFIHILNFDNHNMVEINRGKISNLPKGFVLEKFTWFQGKFYCFYSLWDKANMIEQVFAQEIDPENCAFTGEPVKIISKEGKFKGTFSLGGWSSWKSFWGFGITNKYLFVCNNDSSKLLIVGRDKTETDTDILFMYVLDKNIQTISKNEVKMPYSKERMEISDCILTTDGIPFILAKVIPESLLDASNNKVNYIFELLKVDIETNSVKAFKLRGGQNCLVDEMVLRETSQDELTAVALYNRSARYNYSEGTCLLKIHKNNGLIDQQFYPFSKKSCYSDKKDAQNLLNANGNLEFNNIVFRNIMWMKDNSVAVICEQYYSESFTSMNSSGNVVSSTTYYHLGVFLTKISSDNKLVWNSKICENHYSRFNSVLIGDNICLLFKLQANSKFIKNNKLYRNIYVPNDKNDYLINYMVNQKNGDPYLIKGFKTEKIQKGMKLYFYNIENSFLVSKDEVMMEFYIKNKKDVLIKTKID